MIGGGDVSANRIIPDCIRAARNGEPIIVKAAMKPIPTLYNPLRTVNIDDKSEHKATVERSDVCAVPACSVVVEAVIAFEIAKAFLDKFRKSWR